MTLNYYLNALTPDKRMFVLEYLKDFKTGPASLRAGLAESAGRRFVGELDIQQAIEEQMAERTARIQIDADWVLVQLASMFNADLADIFYPGTNDLRPVHEWPEVWRRMTTGVKIDNKTIGRGDNATEYTVKDIKILDRMRALENIGKHTDVKAFTERIEVSTDEALTKRLMEGRKRALAKRQLDFM